MPDDQYDDETADDDPNESSVIKTLRKQQRDLAAENKTLREQAEQGAVAVKRNALFEAKLGDLNDAQRDAILATAKDATPDAFRAQAEALGFVKPPEPAVSQDDLAAFDRVSAAQSGGAGTGPRDFDAEIAAATSIEEVERLSMERGTHVNVAARG